MTTEKLIPNLGGIVLCGGSSSRMGHPKAWLSLDGETFLQRIVSVLRSVVRPVVVVAGTDGNWPPLPGDVRVVRDESPHLGPLHGLAIGLDVLQTDVDRAFVTGCDTPLLSAVYVRGLASHDERRECVVPVDEAGRSCPLSAIYRTSCAEQTASRVREGRLKLQDFVTSLRVETLSWDDLRAFDPALDSLRNVNTPAEYHELLRYLHGDDGDAFGAISP